MIISKKITLQKYIIHLLYLILIMVSFFYILGINSNPVNSLITCFFSFLIFSLYISYVFIDNKKLVFIILSFFVIKSIIGILHYLYFIDSEYFMHGNYKPMTFEYEGVYNQIISFANQKKINGILYFSTNDGGVTHQELLSIISIPFVFFGNYPLNIIPINAFSSVLITINIYIISKDFNIFDNFIIKHIVVLSSLFPLTLITSLLYRDICGLALMTIGIVLIKLSNKFYIQAIMIAIASYLFYLHRTSYPIIIFFAIIFNSAFNQKPILKGNIFLKGFVILLIFLLIFIITSNLSDSDKSLIAYSSNYKIYSFFIKFILGVIGPFPWINFLQYESIPAYSYQLQDYFQGIFNISIFVIFITNIKKILFSKIYSDFVFLIGMGLLITGILNPSMHITYVSIGFLFFIPYAFIYINYKQFKKYLFITFIMLLIANIIIYFTGNLGLSLLWK